MHIARFREKLDIFIIEHFSLEIKIKLHLHL